MENFGLIERKKEESKLIFRLPNISTDDEIFLRLSEIANDTNPAVLSNNNFNCEMYYYELFVRARSQLE